MRTIIYPIVLLLFIVVLSLLPILNDKTIEFNGENVTKIDGNFLNLYSRYNSIIKNNDTLVLNNTLKTPQLNKTYIGTLRNDTIIKYREKLSGEGEIVYYFGLNNKPQTEYVNGSKKCKDSAVFNFILYSSLIVGFIIMLIRISSYYEPNKIRRTLRDFKIKHAEKISKQISKLMILIFVLEFIFSLLTAFWILNIFAVISTFLLGIITYGILIFVYVWVDNDDIEFRWLISRKLLKKQKTNNLINNFNILLK